MEIALIIDRGSVFNTFNFKRILKDIEKEENVKLSLFINVKKFFKEDFIISFTDKYEEYFKSIKYRVYSVYNDENIVDMLNNDLLYLSEYYSDKEYEELFFYEKSIIKKIIVNFKKNNKLYLDSKDMLNKYYKEDSDYVYKKGTTNILVSAPHNVSQYYMGVYKFADFGTGTIATSVNLLSDCNLIIKTKNMGSVFVNDNANRPMKCKYRDTIKKQIKENKIKAVLDIHALKKSRKEEINIGINKGININHDKELLDKLVGIANKYKFNVSVDKPFNAGKGTISSFVHDECGVIGVQYEINSRFINYNFKSQRYNDLINMLNESVECLNEYIK